MNRRRTDFEGGRLGCCRCRRSPRSRSPTRWRTPRPSSRNTPRKAGHLGRPDHRPEGRQGKTIVIVAGDMQERRHPRRRRSGAKEAAEAIGWTSRVIDGAGSVSRPHAALSQAMALKPDGIIVGGIDADRAEGRSGSSRQGRHRRWSRWHSVPKLGPIEGAPIFANVTPNAMAVAEGGRDMGVSSTPTASPASSSSPISTYSHRHRQGRRRWRREIETAGLHGALLEDTPIADVSNRMPQLTTSLLQQIRRQMDAFAGDQRPLLRLHGAGAGGGRHAGDGAPQNISAGDGSEAAYQRIRAGQYQAVTVAEPLDHAGLAAGRRVEPRLRRREVVGLRPAVPRRDPGTTSTSTAARRTSSTRDNGYRDAYKKIWGV